MRKWLVGLLALACIGATSWAETATYTVASKTEVTLSGTAPDGATAVYEQTANNMGQATANNTLKLTLKGYEGTTITGLKLSMKSNASKGAGSLSVTCGDAIIAGIENSKFNSENWNGAWSTEYVDIVPAVTATSVDGDVVILISATENSLYCQSYTVEYTAGDPVFSVKFDKENWFKVAQGQASSVTAIPQYGIEPYTFLWESDTPELNGGTTDTLEIPATLAEGDYTVACLVTEDNGEGDAINALIGFTVEAIPVITGDNFELVSSSDELQDGMRVLVTDVSHAFAMSSVATGSALASVDVTETDGVITASDESIIWTLVEDSDGNFALQNGEQYVGWPSGNAAKMQADPFANKISVAEGVATITAASDTTRNLKYNKSSPRFAYYTSAQTDLALFKEAGEAGLSVTLDKANGFTVDLGTADSITATAKNGAEPYTYAWTSDTPDLNGTGETLAIPATLAEGDYTVQVEVTDAESNKANKQIYFSVVAPLEPHAINIDVGIQNGTVTSDPEGEAVKGTQVKLTATATTEGYALKEMTVTYGETVLAFTASPATFEMPDEAVSVGAIFAEVKDYAELPFVAEDTPYSGPWQKPNADGLSHKGLGTDYADGSAKFDTTGDWMQVKFTGTPGTLSYAIKGNSLSSDKPSTFLVQESATGADDDWTTLATYVTDDNLTGTKAEASHELSASSQFVRFFYEEKGAGNVGIYDVYISSGGPATFSIKLDPASYFEVEVGEEASIAATPKNAEGEVHYAWTVGGEPAGSDSDVLGLDTTAATEEIEVVCTATDGADTVATASVSYKVVAPAPKFAVNVALGIQNGSVATDVSEAAEGDTVTVTATPEAGYRLVEIIVNNGEVAVTGNTFVMPGQDVLVTATFEEKPPVTGDVLTNDDVGSQTSSYKDWTAEKESGAVYAGQTAGGSATNPCIQLRSSNNSGIVMTKDSGQNVSSVTIEWNAQSAAERVVQVYGSTTPYSSPADLYGDAKGTLLGELTNGSGEVTVDVAAVGEFPYIGIRSKSGALFLTSVAIDFGGAAAFSIALDPAEDFEVPQGTDAAITATVRGAQGDVTYSWSVNGTPIDLAGNVYAIDSAEVGGPYEVVCEASDGVSDPVSASVSYSVVEVPPVTGDEFTLITSVDDLEDGAEYVITDNSQAYAIKSVLSDGSTKRLLNEPVAPVDGVITTDDASIVWKLVAVEGGSFAFYNDSIGKYIGWSSGNSAKFQDDAFANTISYEDDLFVVMATSTAELEKPRKLQFNSSSTSLQFAYYEGTQKNLCFFKKSDGPGPQPGEPALVFGGDSEGTVDTPVNFTVEAINMANTDIYGGWTEHEGLFDAPEGSALSDAGVTQDFPNVSFTPDVAGQYVFYFNAGEGDEYREGSWTVTVTGEGPGPQPSDAAITKMTIASGKMTIEFTGTAPQVLLSDDMQTWTAVDGAISPFEFNMDEADKKYIGVR